MASDPAIESTRRLAHDLRNVLVSLQSVASAIERVLDPRHGELAGQLALAVERAASLSRRLAATDDDDPFVRAPDRCRLAAALRRSHSLLERVAAPVPIELHAEEQQGEVRVSEEALERIAINLVRNARRASGPVGCIVVTAHRRVDAAGVGVDVLTVDNPDPRPQVERRWSRMADGAIEPGLGLTIVRELVESAFGDVELWRSSEALMRVVCTFPVIPERFP